MGSGKMTKCPGCRAEFAEYDGPVHNYFGESAGCWKAYGEVLAREYESIEYWKVHRLTVDTYAAQHPFNTDRRNIQSVNIHLMALYAIVELGQPFDVVPPLLKRAAHSFKNDFKFLPPPTDLGEMTVKEVLEAKSAEEHCEKVWLWTRSVWRAWKSQSTAISQLYQKTLAL